MRYQPKQYNFRAVLWRGDPADLPSDWLDTGRLTLEADGTLVLQTLRGPAPAEPDGNWYVREHSAELRGHGVDEVWPVRRDVFEAQYEGVA